MGRCALHIETSIDIEAAPEAVWQVLIAVERWPEWTASMRRIEHLDAGGLGPGSRLRIKQPRLPSGIWEVTDFQAGQRFSWSLRSPGATTLAEHLLEARPDGGTRVLLRVEQSGILARILSPLYTDLSRRYMAMEAEGLKARCESR